MITTDQILTNAFFAFFYCLGNAVDYIWAGAFTGAIVLTLTRLFSKKDNQS
jgi:multisubunit Na+/H+ antiporter MnhE subunit